MLTRAALLLVAASGAARADVGIQLGPRGGVAIDRGDPSVGLDARLSVPSSPLTIEATFDDIFDAGLGVSHVFTRHVGLRVDGRYVRALVDEDAHSGGYFKDYGFLRMSAGVSVGF